MDYSCHVLSPKSLPSVKVRQWENKDTYKDYKFPLFKDDTIQTILLKIIHYLKLTEEPLFPYIWSDDKPLRFKFIKNNWDKYNVNPFFANLKDSPNIPDIQSISDRITHFTDINIVTYTHLKNIKSQIQKYYFPNEKDTFKTNEIQVAMYEQQLLEKLWLIPPEKHTPLISTKVCSYTRAFFTSTVKSTDSYRILFDGMEGFEFIQFYNDRNNIIYKVKKAHRIPNNLFDEWRTLEHTKDNSIVIYSFIKNSTTSYMKLIMNNSKEVNIMYYIDVLENIGYEKIKGHLDDIVKQLQIITEPTVERLAVKTSISIQDVNLKSLSVAFTKLPMIYNVPSKNRIQKNILDVQYKRVEKYGMSTDITEVIKSKLELGIQLIDIITELQEYGMEEAEVREYIEQIQKGEPQKKKKRDFKSIGLLIIITPIALGLNINVNNASSYTEIQTALSWIRASVLNVPRSAHVTQTIEQPPSPTTSIPEFVPRQFSHSSESSGSELSLGGAIGKKHQRFFNTMLNNIDSEMFAKTANYATKCGVSALRQPIGMTLEDKKRIDDLGYSDGYDNFMVHGSTPENQNVYMCPRIYCPTSKVPLSYKKYVANGEKCPDPEEEPILLYTTDNWYNDPTRPHYVGFLKEKGFNNINLPCCFAKEQKDLPTSVKDVPKDKKPQNDAYIIDKIKQLQEGRFGSLPISLHTLLHPNVPHVSCKNSVKSKECVLRIGVAQSTDSLMTSIAYLLEYKSKADLCTAIKDKLDPFTFITLENGKVYTYFIPEKPILPDTNPQKCKLLKKWLQEHKSYTKLYNLEEIMPYLDHKEIIPSNIGYRIARQLIIHESYRRFIEYICSDEEKNPYILFDLIHHIGAVLIIWNRDNQNIATMRCPYTTKNKEWYSGAKLIPYIMVMNQENYYEPLIVIDQYHKLKQKISFTHFEKLQKIIEACPVMMKYEDKEIQDIFTLSKWIEILLTFPKKFKMKTIVLDPQDCAIGCFLANNLYIEFTVPLSPFSLKSLIERCDIDHIAYWEDIAYDIYDINVNVFDYRILQIKIQKLGLGMNIGTITEQTDTKIVAIYSVPSVKYRETPKVPLILKTTGVYNDDSKKWRTVKKQICKKLLAEYDKLVLPLLKMSKLSQLHKLFENFVSLDEAARVAVILEEIPYYDKILLQKYYEEVLLDKPYYYKDKIVHENKAKTEWIFNQKVPEVLLENIKNPTTIHRPNNAPNKDTEIIIDTQLADNIPLPDLLNVAKLTFDDLPYKWRSKKLKEYKLGILSSYSPNDSLLEVFEWIAQLKGVKFDITDLHFYLKKQITQMLENPDTYELILEDPMIRSQWNDKLGRKYRNAREIIDMGFKGKTVAELQKLWNSMQQYPVQDIDLYNISRLFNVNFLILQKGKDVYEARGNLPELTNSSKFIGTRWKETPILILSKYISENKKHNIYNIIVNKDKRILYYHSGKDVPTEFRDIIEGHHEKA